MARDLEDHEILILAERSAEESQLMVAQDLERATLLALQSIAYSQIILAREVVENI